MDLIGNSQSAAAGLADVERRRGFDTFTERLQALAGAFRVVQERVAQDGRHLAWVLERRYRHGQRRYLTGREEATLNRFLDEVVNRAPEVCLVISRQLSVLLDARLICSRQVYPALVAQKALDVVLLAADPRVAALAARERKKTPLAALALARSPLGAADSLVAEVRAARRAMFRKGAWPSDRLAARLMDLLDSRQGGYEECLEALRRELPDDPSSRQALRLARNWPAEARSVLDCLASPHGSIAAVASWMEAQIRALVVLSHEGARPHDRTNQPLEPYRIVEALASDLASVLALGALEYGRPARVEEDADPPSPSAPSEKRRRLRRKELQRARERCLEFADPAWYGKSFAVRWRETRFWRLLPRLAEQEHRR